MTRVHARSSRVAHRRAASLRRMRRAAAVGTRYLLLQVVDAHRVDGVLPDGRRWSLWAFLTLYLAPTNNFLRDAPGFFIGAVLLWDVLFRGQLGVSLTFIEEIYSRNLGNLFVVAADAAGVHRRASSRSASCAR